MRFCSDRRLKDYQARLQKQTRIKIEQAQHSKQEFLANAGKSV
jgi:hypothetical protein